MAFSPGVQNQPFASSCSRAVYGPADEPTFRLSAGGYAAPVAAEAPVAAVARCSYSATFSSKSTTGLINDCKYLAASSARWANTWIVDGRPLVVPEMCVFDRCAHRM